MPETAELNRAAAVKGITGSFGGAFAQKMARNPPGFWNFLQKTALLLYFFVKNN